MLASSVTDNGEAVPDGGMWPLMEEVLMGGFPYAVKKTR